MQAVFVTGHPLTAFLALLAAGVALSRLLFRKHPLGRAAARIVFLIMLTCVLLRVDIVPYQPLQPTGVPIRDFVRAVLTIAWWLWAAWFLVGILHAFLLVQRRSCEARLAHDLPAGVIYLAALFAIAGYVFDLSIEGMLATSGAIAMILGLALQSTLGDVFSGIVLSFSRPYRPGDWINIDGGTEGRASRQSDDRHQGDALRRCHSGRLYSAEFPVRVFIPSSRCPRTDRGVNRHETSEDGIGARFRCGGCAERRATLAPGLSMGIPRTTIFDHGG